VPSPVRAPCRLSSFAEGQLIHRPVTDSLAPSLAAFALPFRSLNSVVSYLAKPCVRLLRAHLDLSFSRTRPMPSLYPGVAGAGDGQADGRCAGGAGARRARRLLRDQAEAAHRALLRLPGAGRPGTARVRGWPGSRGPPRSGSATASSPSPSRSRTSPARHYLRLMPALSMALTSDNAAVEVRGR
jgi:hypothetical protein